MHKQLRWEVEKSTRSTIHAITFDDSVACKMVPPWGMVGVEDVKSINTKLGAHQAPSSPRCTSSYILTAPCINQCPVDRRTFNFEEGLESHDHGRACCNQTDPIKIHLLPTTPLAHGPKLTRYIEPCRNFALLQAPKDGIGSRSPLLSEGDGWIGYICAWSSRRIGVRAQNWQVKYSLEEIMSGWMPSWTHLKL